MLNHFKNLSKNTIIYGTARFMCGFFSVLLLTPILTKTFSPAQYGVIDYLLTINAFLLMLLACGIESAVARYYYDTTNIRKRNQYVSNGFLFLLVELVVITIILIIFSKPISNILLKDINLYKIFILSVLSVPFTLLFNYSLQVLRITFKSWQYLFLSTLNVVVLFLIAYILLVVKKYGLSGIFISYLFSSVFTFLVSFFFIKHQITLKINKKYLKNLLSYGIPFVPAFIALWIINLSDRIFITQYLSFEDLGIYSLAVKISSIVALVISAFTLTWEPFAFSIQEDKNARVIYARILTYYLIVVSFIALLIIYLSKPIIILLANAQYLDARNLLIYLVTSSIIYGAFFIVAIGTNLAKKTHNIAYSTLVAATVNIGLNFFFIPHFGILGAAITTLIAYLIATIFIFILSQKHYSIPYEYTRIIKICLPYLALAYISIFFRNFPSTLETLTCIATLIIYICTLWIVILNPNEKVVIIRYIKKILTRHR